MSFNLKDFIDFWVFGALGFIFTICTFFVSLRVKAKISEAHEKRTLRESINDECDNIDWFIALVQKQESSTDLPFNAQKILLHLNSAYPNSLKPFNRDIVKTLKRIKKEKLIKQTEYFELMCSLKEHLMKEVKK